MRNAVHQALREGTANAHDGVDAAFAGFDLTDRESYARFLSAHAEVVLPLEAALPGERVIDDWEGRKRGYLLREDLAQLPKLTPDRHPGESREFGPARGAGTARDPGFRRDDDYSIAGTLYVLEGSRLGGKFLSRRLPTGFPRAYLNADQRAGNWQHLLGVIDGLLRDPLALDAALAAALATFTAFERSAKAWKA